MNTDYVHNFNAIPNNESILLQWSPVESLPLLYHVYYSTIMNFIPGSENVTAIAVENDKNHIIIENLKNQIVYYFKIAAVNSDGIESTYSSLQAIPTNKINNFTAIPQNESVILSWSCFNILPLMYHIYYSTEFNFIPGNTNVTAIPVNPTDNCLNIINLQNQTQYYFKIAAVNSDGLEGPYTDLNIFITNIVENFKANTENNSIVLSWNSLLPNPLVYHIYYSNTSNFIPGTNDVVAMAVNSDTNNVIIDNLDINLQYYFKIAAVDSQGLEGPYSDTMTL
jgi:hypothetical protein